MDISLFRSIASEFQNLRSVNTVATMNEISRHIEDQVIKHAMPIDFYAGFQRFSHFPAQLRRYSLLGAVCRRVYVFGIPDVQPPTIPGVVFIEISPTSALAREWFLIVNTPQFWTALLTEEVKGRDTTTGGRRFDGMWTYDARVIERAALLISQAMGECYQPLQQRDYEQQNVHIAEISGRMIGNLEAARQVGQRRWTQLSTIQKFSEAVSKSYNTPRINEYPFYLLRDTVQILCSVFGATDAVIALRDRNEQCFVVAAEGSIGTNGHSLQITDGPSGRALSQGAVVHVADMYRSRERDPLLPTAATLIAAPITGRERIHGVVTLGMNEPEQWNNEDSQTVLAIASLLGMIIESKSETNGDTSSQLERIRRLEQVLIGLRRQVAQLLEVQGKLYADTSLGPAQHDLVTQINMLSTRLAQSLGISNDTAHPLADTKTVTPLHQQAVNEK